jgi:putative ABC transport system permease protein
MNLTTARSANRAKEVGVRKMLGTKRKELIVQFLSECTLMVVLSLLIAIGIVWRVLPLFNDVASKSMNLMSLFSPVILPVLIVLPFVVGLLAGSYPAFFLSAFNPVEVLKGKLSRGSKSGGLRNLLVVFQFTTSIVLIIGTIVIYRQLHYIQTTNVGFDKKQVLIINNAYRLNNNIEPFKNEVLQMPGVVSATVSGYLPVSSSNRSDNVFSISPVMDVQNGFDMQQWGIDYDYIKTMGMDIVKGRNFSRDFGSDSDAVIINETTAKKLGLTDPIGKKLYSVGDHNTAGYTIIGVVKNFHYESLRQNVGLLGLFLASSRGAISFKINTTNIPEVLKQIEKKWKAMAPGMPYDYRFLDEAFNNMYRAEQRIGKIILIFSTLAILIACLGLFGLSTFIAEQRTKEIGIRKVLGASVTEIVQLLSKDFIKLVVLSFIIAAPVAWYFMNKWLQDFANRTTISWWIFLLAGALTLVIALFTVSFQAIKTATANPVDSLKTE